MALERKPTTGKPPDIRQSRISVFQEQSGAREFREANQEWMISLTQGQFGTEEVRQTVGDTLSRESIGTLTCVCDEPLKYRNRAVAILSHHRHIRVAHIAGFLGVTHSLVDSWVRKFAQHGCGMLLPITRQYCKARDKTYRGAIFEADVLVVALGGPGSAPSPHYANNKNTTFLFLSLDAAIKNRWRFSYLPSMNPFSTSLLVFTCNGWYKEGKLAIHDLSPWGEICPYFFDPDPCGSSSFLSCISIIAFFCSGLSLGKGTQSAISCPTVTFPPDTPHCHKIARSD